MATSNAAAEAERDLRLRAEELIVAAPTMPPDEALAGLADLEARALALAGAGVVDGTMVMGLLVSTVDALAVRRIAWLEPAAADLDPVRLHEAAGSSRPELRAVVAVASGCVAVWDDRVEARLVDGPRIVGNEQEIADLLGVDLGRGIEGRTKEVETAARDADRYLDGLSTWCAGEAHRHADDVDHLNRLRRRLVAAVAALGRVGKDAVDRPAASHAAGAGGDRSGRPLVGGELVDRFDSLVASLQPVAMEPSLVEVVPLAVRAGDRWLLALERWTDHWRLLVAGPTGRGTWTAADADGRSYGGAIVDDGVLRFDPALEDAPVRTITWGADGSSDAVTVEVGP